jgi:hypothetical protein
MLFAAATMTLAGTAFVFVSTLFLGRPSTTPARA